MRRIILVLSLLSAPGLLAAQDGKTPSDQTMKQGISEAALAFHDRLSQLRSGSSGIAASGDVYTLKDFNSALALTRLQLFKLLPDQAGPLRKYIERHFPAAIQNASSSGGVNQATADQTISATDSLLQTLKNASPYRLDLVVDSNPRDALFQLNSPMGDVLSRGTRGTMTNVWRGDYSYTVSKPGYKTIVGKVDLVREVGNTLVCHFVPNESADVALPCGLS